MQRLASSSPPPLPLLPWNPGQALAHAVLWRVERFSLPPNGALGVARLLLMGFNAHCCVCVCVRRVCMESAYF